MERLLSYVISMITIIDCLAFIDFPALCNVKGGTSSDPENACERNNEGNMIHVNKMHARGKRFQEISGLHVIDS